jgi:hypothetical protein
MPSFVLVSFQLFLEMCPTMFGGHPTTDIDKENIYYYVKFLYGQIDKFPLRWNFSSNQELIQFVFKILSEEYFEHNVVGLWSYVVPPTTPERNLHDWEYLNGYYHSECYSINPFLPSYYAENDDDNNNNR